MQKIDIGLKQAIYCRAARGERSQRAKAVGASLDAFSYSEANN